jgi:uncharacterized repeat protein (TIGR01451 family)
MSFPSKWALGTALAVAALLTAFSMSSSASAGDDDDGGRPTLDKADIECDKVVVGSETETDIVVELADPIAFEIICEIIEDASKGTAPFIFDELTIIDTLPDNFVIDNAVCEFHLFGPEPTPTAESAPGGTAPVGAQGGPGQVGAGFLAEIDGQTVICVFDPTTTAFEGSFVAGDRFVLQIEGEFVSGPCGDIKNEARGEFGGDVDIAVEFIFLECEDIAVTKTAVTLTDATGATVAQGGTIVYTIEVCNLGTGFGEAQQVFFADLLPLGAEFESAASADFELTVDGSLVVGTKDSLQPDDCGTAFITVDTADDASCGFTFTNRVQAGSSQITSDIVFNESNFVPENDGDPSNNSAEFVTTVACPDSDAAGEDDDGEGPSVGTGDSGLLEDGSSVSTWQLGLLSLLVVASLGGAYVGYRRVR